MMIQKRNLSPVLFIVLPYISAAEPLANSTVAALGSQRHPVIAVTETLVINALFTGVTSFVFNFAWARPSAATIYNNFNSPWDWEATDGFQVNQIGHPYQGSLYFNAGRANGFTFYESLLFSALGSFTWEAVCERQTGSLNDMITTAFGAAPVGEMLHALFLEALASGAPLPLATLISPLDGVNRLITGKTAPRPEGGNLYNFSIYAGAGYSTVHSREKSRNTSLFAFSGFAGNIGAHIVYGNPYEQQSAVPYKHFELKASIDADIGNYFNVRIVSDGYLFSFSPINTETTTASTGLSLHFDCVSQGKFDMYDSDIDQYSNAIDWTFKYQRLLPNDFTVRLRLHGGLTFFGVSEYYAPETNDKSLKNYGAGTNIKVSAELEHHLLGALFLNIYHYYLQSFSAIVPFDAGSVFWLFADITYIYRISKHISFGISDYFSLETGIFSGVPNTKKYANTVKTFVMWRF